MFHIHGFWISLHEAANILLQFSIFFSSANCYLLISCLLESWIWWLLDLRLTSVFLFFISLFSSFFCTSWCKFSVFYHFAVYSFLQIWYNSACFLIQMLLWQCIYALFKQFEHFSSFLQCNFIMINLVINKKLTNKHFPPTCIMVQNKVLLTLCDGWPSGHFSLFLLFFLLNTSSTDIWGILRIVSNCHLMSCSLHSVNSSLS